MQFIRNHDEENTERAALCAGWQFEGQRSAFRLLPVIELFMLRRTDTGDDDDDHYSYTLLERLCISHSSE